ncbi:MAG: hypothetical protein AAB527_03050 [Patescibacteria group bacterium]
MKNILSFLSTKKVSGVVIAVAFSFLLVALITYGATTISTNINTGGALDVSGASTLTNITASASSTFNATLTVGGAATFSSEATFNKALRASSTADFTGAFATYGATTLGDAAVDNIIITGNASTTNSLTVNKDFYVDGTASTTNLLVGSGSSAIRGLLVGFCSVNPGVAVVASSTKQATCSDATGVRVGDKIFIMSTTTPPGQNAGLRITAASSTAADAILLEITHATGSAASLTAQSFNFWVVR